MDETNTNRSCHKLFILSGNELIHRLTSDGRTYSVRFDLEAYDGEKIYAIYNKFSVGPESDNYILDVSDFDETSTGGKKPAWYFKIGFYK